MSEERKDKEKLPNGWKWTSLGEITKKISIKVLPVDYPDAKFIGMDCIQPHTLKPSFTYRFEEFKSSGNYFKTGQVLYGIMRPYLNKVYRAEYDGTCSGEFIVLQCHEWFNPDLLKYILHARDFVNFTNQKTSGDRPRISYEEIAEYPIALAPINEQQAIVSKIEELLSDLENGKQQLQIAQQQLKVYRQSLLKWAFEGKLTNKNVKDGELPKEWKIVTITDLAEKSKHSLKAGPFGSSLKKEFYKPDGYKIYGQEQVISDNAFIGDYYVNEEKYQELKSCKIRPLDILISLVGTVGKVLILPQNCKPGIINPRLIKISLNTEIYLPKFFKYYFESSYVKSLYGSKAQGTTMDVLNLGIIKTIPFPFPTLGEQQLIVDELESKLTVCDKIEETISQSLLQAESLRQSILKKAFEGKLI